MVWGKAGSTTLSSSGTDLSVTSMANSVSGMALGSHSAGGTSIKFNNDNGSNGSGNYAVGRSSNGGAKSNNASRNGDNAYITDVRANPHFNVTYFINIASEEKLWINSNVHQNTAGTGTAPAREKGVGKWANTSDAISQMDYHCWNGTYSSGDNITVLGSDLTPAAGVDGLGANLQVGSRYEETDTRKMYNLVGADTPMYETDFSSSTGWTTVGSNITITGGVIQASAMVTQTDNRIYYDLGSALSDKFVIDFDHYADSSPANSFWQMFALTDTTAIPRTDDGIYPLIDMGSWDTYLRYSNEGSETNVGTLGSLTTGQWQYVRFVRDGTTGTLTVYSDSARTTQVLNVSGTIPATVTGLRYFQSGALASANTGTATYKIDNLKIYDGVNTVN